MDDYSRLMPSSALIFLLNICTIKHIFYSLYKILYVTKKWKPSYNRKCFRKLIVFRTRLLFCFSYYNITCNTICI